MTRLKTTFALVLGMLLLAVVIAACGGGGDGGTTGGGEEAGSTSASSGSESGGELAAFEEKIEKDLKVATAEDPARPPTDGPKAVPGKSIYVIACAFQAEGCKRPAVAAAEAAEAIGWKVTLIDTGGDPSKAGNSIAQAISQKADGIIVNAFDGPALSAPLEKAKAAGIKTVGMVAADPNNNYDIAIPSTLKPDGYLIGQQAYQLAHGDVKALLFTGKEFGVVQQRQEGIEEFISECQEVGGECEILAEQDVIAAQLGTQAPGQAAALARSNPDFTVVFSPYDGAGTFILQGLEQSGVDLSNSFMVGFDANAPNLDIIREGGYQKATIGFPLEWMGWQAVDDLNRMFDGQEPVELNTLHKLLTQENVPAEGAWEGDYPEFRQAFEKEWGV